MKQKIIGYKLSKPEYEKAALEIAKITDLDIIPDKGYAFCINSTVYWNFKEAGVLDLWFEPVYGTINSFKVGDLLIYNHKGSKHDQDIIKITMIIKTSVDDFWINHTPNSFSGGGFKHSSYKDHIRLVTEKDKENAKTLPNIGGHNPKIVNDRIHYGCKSISIKALKEMLDLGISYIEIENKRYTITNEVLSKFSNYININNL